MMTIVNYSLVIIVTWFLDCVFYLQVLYLTTLQLDLAGAIMQADNNPAVDFICGVVEGN